MILGSGLLGLAFLQHKSSLPANVLVIARGVSDSLETCDAAYAREWQLLEEAVLKAEAKTRLVYFSTSRLDTPVLPFEAHLRREQEQHYEPALAKHARQPLVEHARQPLPTPEHNVLGTDFSVAEDVLAVTDVPKFIDPRWHMTRCENGHDEEQ